MKMKEIAERIDAHLKRFEADPEINTNTKPDRTGLSKFWHAGAYYGGGSRMSVTYVSYQHAANITKAEAEQYLAWLDAGNVGKHFEALRS